MPQASEELRSVMQRRFGSPVDASGPIRFLEEQGWTLNEDWTWSHPDKLLETMSDGEFECVLFLIHEWDFGSVGV